MREERTQGRSYTPAYLNGVLFDDPTPAQGPLTLGRPAFGDLKLLEMNEELDRAGHCLVSRPARTHHKSGHMVGMKLQPKQCSL